MNMSLGAVHFLHCIPGRSILISVCENVSYPQNEIGKMFHTPKMRLAKCFVPLFLPPVFCQNVSYPHTFMDNKCFVPHTLIDNKCFIPPLFFSPTLKCFVPPYLNAQMFITLPFFSPTLKRTPGIFLFDSEYYWTSIESDRGVFSG